MSLLSRGSSYTVEPDVWGRRGSTRIEEDTDVGEATAGLPLAELSEIEAYTGLGSVFLTKRSYLYTPVHESK
jgi:hypothetical protein